LKISILPPNFPKIWFLALNLALLYENSLTIKSFSSSQKFKGGNFFPHLSCPATMPLSRGPVVPSHVSDLCVQDGEREGGVREASSSDRGGETAGTETESKTYH